MKLCIAILTTATRPETLTECIQRLCELALPKIEEIAILIVENRSSPSEHVAQVIASAQKASAIDVYLLLEKQLGIPHGRNAALNFALNNSYSHLAFIDDDAAPEVTWLTTMVDVLQEAGAEAVNGPQVPVFPNGTSALYRNATVYKERQLNDRTVCSWAATNNVIFDVNYAKHNNLEFSRDMKTGGSDKEFFSRYSKCGAKILWVKNAVVKEYVEPQRINMKWAIKRAFRFGGTGFRIERCTKNNILAVASCLFKGGCYIAYGCLGLFILPWLRNRSVLDALCNISHGLGFLLSIFSGGRLKSYT
jgi:hypothetical protein